MAGSPTFFSDGHVPRRTDAIWVVTQKILGAIVDGGGGGGGGSNEIFQGAAFPPVAPPTDPTKPAIYYQNGGSATAQWDVPSQTWV